MGRDFGQQDIGFVGGMGPECAYGTDKITAPIGVTLDWATVTAVASTPKTLKDGTVVPVGSKCLDMGQVMTKITASGKYGPYDSAASDGRQTLTQGDTYILNRPIVENPVVGIGTQDSNHAGEYLIGGTVWLARIIQVGTGTASLAAGPTLATLKAAMPRITFFNPG